MIHKRTETETERFTKPALDGNGTVLTGEATRAAAESPAASNAKSDEKKEENLSLFWRVFGGTIISMVALGALTLYNNLSANISELRRDLNSEREARSDLVKKEEFNSRTTSQYERIRALENLKADIEALKERANTNAAAIETLKREANAGLDSLRKDLTATNDLAKKDAGVIDLLKERITNLETLKKDLAGLDVLKEKLSGLTGDLKAVRDEIAKLTQEQERNKAADLERKLIRDTQYKQVEEQLRELQKGLQECREKLARLDALLAPPAPRGTPAERDPPRPAEPKPTEPKPGG